MFWERKTSLSSDDCIDKKIIEYSKLDPQFKLPERGVIREKLDAVHNFMCNDFTSDELKNLIDDYLYRVGSYKKEYTNLKISLDSMYDTHAVRLVITGERLMDDEEYDKAKRAYIQKWESFQELKKELTQQKDG